MIEVTKNNGIEYITLYTDDKKLISEMIIDRENRKAWLDTPKCGLERLSFFYFSKLSTAEKIQRLTTVAGRL